MSRTSNIRITKNSLYRTEEYIDLFAKKAKFHPSCWKAFNTEYDNFVCPSEWKQTYKEQALVEGAHSKVFCEITNFIYKHVIENNDMSLSRLRLVWAPWH